MKLKPARSLLVFFSVLAVLALTAVCLSGLQVSIKIFVLMLCLVNIFYLINRYALLRSPRAITQISTQAGVWLVTLKNGQQFEDQCVSQFRLAHFAIFKFKHAGSAIIVRKMLLSDHPFLMKRL